jgi:hypothetical protein
MCVLSLKIGGFMKKSFILFLILVFSASTLFAEVISLKDGSSIKGKIVKDNGTEITVNDDKKTYIISWDKIKNVKFDEDSQQIFDKGITGFTPAEKVTPPTDAELKIAQIQAYYSIKALNTEIAGLKDELSQVRSIMGIELGLTAATIALAVISYFVISNQINN